MGVGAPGGAHAIVDILGPLGLASVLVSLVGLVAQAGMRDSGGDSWLVKKNARDR